MPLSSFLRRQESRQKTFISILWIPAFAGMTVCYFSAKALKPHVWIPACAGMTPFMQTCRRTDEIPQNVPHPLLQYSISGTITRLSSGGKNAQTKNTQRNQKTFSRHGKRKSNAPTQWDESPGISAYQKTTPESARNDRRCQSRNSKNCERADSI